ncbi:hypothetical protein N7535_005988 [Penicillium sp. DV-2018c]|nr:hypothetical protein N7461_009567 [Penicillium sp. DV-2018c]KAJ5572328.1 hypothetical protein N7535_005988 [Penicillium sp. DV-2018c]
MEPQVQKVAVEAHQEGAELPNSRLELKHVRWKALSDPSPDMVATQSQADSDPSGQATLRELEGTPLAISEADMFEH